MTPYTQSFRTTDGATLFYDDEGLGPTVLLVHGFSRRAAHWGFQRQALLAAGYRTIVCSAPGGNTKDGEREAP
jgi:pimeloyl-ACP methyl ester carboxylesterase